MIIFFRTTESKVSLHEIWAADSFVKRRLLVESYLSQGQCRKTMWGVDVGRRLLMTLLESSIYISAFPLLVFVGWLCIRANLSVWLVIFSSFLAATLPFAFVIWLRLKAPLISRMVWINRRENEAYRVCEEDRLRKMITHSIADCLLIQGDLLRGSDGPVELRSLYRYWMPPLLDELGYTIYMSSENSYSFEVVQEALSRAVVAKPKSIRELVSSIEHELVNGH